MTKKLESLILEEIATAINLLKAKGVINEAAPDAGVSPDPLAADPNLNPGLDTAPPMPGLDDSDVPVDDMGPSAPGEEATEEEEKDPVQSTFDELEELSEKTEDITKIVKTIKANAQSKFEGYNDPALAALVNKINDEGTILMKTALNTRPELADLRALIKTPAEDVITLGDTMKIKESEIKELAVKIAKARVQKLTENADYSATEVIMHIAAKMVMDLKRDIVKEFNLIHPDQMSPEVQSSFTNITGEMQTKIAHAIGETLEKLQKFPRVQDKEAVPAAKV